MIKKFLLFPFALLAYVFGRFSWSAPPWMTALGSLIRSYRRQSAILLLAMVLAVGGYFYYDSLPKPISVKPVVSDIAVTPNRTDASPDSLDISFEYDLSALNDDQERPSGQPSVARIDLVGEEISEGIDISPVIDGKWRWVDDRHLRFEPVSDWPAGSHFAVRFTPALFSEDTLLSQDSVEFQTPALEQQIASIEFYQEPLDVSVRRVIATIRFSHPVDGPTLENRLEMSMRPTDSTIDVEPETYRFEVTYDENRREAYIQSEPVQLPENPSYMRLTLADGVETLLGGKASALSIEDRVLIPDIYSFLKVRQLSTRIVRNDLNEPEQLLLLEFTDDIGQAELLQKLALYSLPTDGQPAGKRHWNSPRQVTGEVIANSQKLELRLVPNERNHSQFYNFVIDAPEDRQLYLRIDPGLTSVNQFVHAEFYDAILRTSRYPREAKIAGEGSILTYSGEQQLSVLTRGLSAVKLVVGKLIKGQLNHLVTQTSGDMTNPRFTSWNFTEENIAEIDSLILNLERKHPRESNYFSVDLNQYLPRGESRFGLFFVEVRGWDETLQREIRGANDKRLILVTDLGVIVKNNADRSHDVFVQSIASGNPVTDAEVRILGKNGLPIVEAFTDDRGHVAIPSTTGFEREKAPTAFVVRSGTDHSFMPYDRGSRQINLSRFDVGGIRQPEHAEDSLNAFLFSDRGMYRPGETVNLGMIVKNIDLSNVEGIPLEVVILGPRYQEALVRRVTLPENGFFEFQFETEPTSITGIYAANLHLVRDQQYRGRQIGSVRFDVEEFQPQTMRIRSELQDVVERGWNTQEELVSRVKLTNLFGTPAQDRKMAGRVIIEPYGFNFSQYSEYEFTDPRLKKDKEPLRLNQQLPDQRSDANGEAEFEIDLQAFREGTYRLRFVAEGFDQAGGRSVTAVNSALISPLETLVGFKADGGLEYINADSERNIHFIAIDKALQMTRATDLKLNRIEIQQVSTLVKQPNNTYKYQTVSRDVELSSESISIDADGMQYAIDTRTPGDFALEIVDAQGLRLARVVFSVVGFANLAGKIDKSAELQLKLDRQDYFAGDTIEMSIRAPYAGSGLITIETDRVHHFKWFRTQAESSVQRIEVPDDLEGTGYVNVAFVRDADSSEIFTSPLSYAVQPFSIDKSRRRIDVSLETERIVRPGKAMQIGFSTSRPARIAVFAVDEGILQVSGYQTPDPLGHFLQKRALQVSTLQILDLILPEFELVKALAAAGGGADAMAAQMLAQNLNPFTRKTDRPAVFWSGIVDADRETATVSFDVPDTFAGELRVMAVAVGETAVGATSQSSIVRGPFVISPNLLTQAAPGDEFAVTVGVANIIEGSGAKAPVDLRISSSEHIEILGETGIRLEIDEGSEERYSFRARARQILGPAEIRFNVSHADEDAARIATLSVRPATSYVTQLATGYADEPNFEIDLRRSLLREFSEQHISASASPLVVVDGLTSYLENFPHGCTEQVVSKVFPLVGLSAHPAYGPHMPDVEAHFAELIDKLRERQLSDGGFAFWPGHRSSADYPSIYVMHFLLESSQRGISVPPDMIRRGKSFLEGYAGRRTRTLDEARSRANAIYLLTRMGEVTTNFLVDLEEELDRNHDRTWKQDLLAAYMAATYRLLQKDDEALRLIDGYEMNNSEHRALDDFHSLLAIDSQYVFLLARHFPDRARELSGESLLRLTRPIFEGRYNTISSAYAILAIGAVTELQGGTLNENIVFAAIDAVGQERRLDVAMDPFPTASYSTETRKLRVEGEQSMYYLNLQAGYDDRLPQQAVSEGIEIFRDFVDEDGNSVTRFEQGKTLTVRIRVRALDDRRLHNVAIIDLLPGGFEVDRRSVSATARNWLADYIDIREDRVVYYGSFTDKVRELRYRVKLTAAGNFVIPPTYAESMYDRSVRAVAVPGRFEVVTSE